ncbi:hypothetical protein, partial [Enterobacter asburiae]
PPPPPPPPPPGFFIEPAPTYINTFIHGAAVFFFYKRRGIKFCCAVLGKERCPRANYIFYLVI